MRLIRFLAALVVASVSTLAFLTVGNSASAAAAVPVPYGIVGCWPGDNSADDIAGRSDGVITGATFGRCPSIGLWFSEIQARHQSGQRQA